MKTKLLSLRRKLSNPPQFVPNQLLNKLSELDPAGGGDILAHTSRDVGQRQVDRLPLPRGRRLLALDLATHSAPNVRTGSQAIKENVNSAENEIAVRAHCKHIAHMPKPPASTTSAQKGYAGFKKRTNLSIDSRLVDIATKHFPATRHASLSGFVENAIRREFRAMAPKLRKAGFKLPDELFAK